MTFAPPNFARSASIGVLAIVSTLLISGSMPGSIDPAADNDGYELTGGIEQWETTVLLGGDFELTGHIEPMWEGGQHVDDQLCDDSAMPASPSMQDWQDQAEPSRCRAALDADDIIGLVRMWGVCPSVSCAADLTGDGLVETADLMMLLFSDPSGVTSPLVGR